MTGESTEKRRTSVDSKRVSNGGLPRLSLALIAGLIFWGWLVLRWINNWFGGVLVMREEPFIPPEFFAGIATWFSSLVNSLGFGAVIFTRFASLFESIAFVVGYLPELAVAAWLTVVLTVSSIALGFVLAVPLSVARVYGNYSKYVALVYTELIRGTPLLAQLFVLYYGLPWLSEWFRELPGVGGNLLPAAAFWIAIIGFTLNSAAYQSEYIRGAIESVDAGQITAGRSIGLSKLSSIRYVVLPQGLRYAIPGWTNELVYLIKYSSLAAFITVPELFNQIQSIAAATFRYTDLFIVAALFYLALVLSASSFMSAVERWVAIPGLSQGTER